MEPKVRYYYILYTPFSVLDSRKYINLTGKWKLIDDNGNKILSFEHDKGWISEEYLRYEIEYPIQECSV